MNREHSMDINEIDGQVTMKSSFFKNHLGQDNPYQSMAILDGRRVLLRRKSPSKKWPDDCESFSYGNTKVLRDWLIGAVERSWSGVVAVDDGFATKQIYMQEGTIVFCDSDSVDDRLGEVLFRFGRIHVQDLVEAAAKVEDGVKFGQVLIRQGTLDACAVWQGLCDQMRWILRSIFFPPHVYFETSSKMVMPPSSVVLPESSAELIKEAASFGGVLREFSAALNDLDVIEASAGNSKILPQVDGFFQGDLMEMIHNNSTVGAFVQAFRADQKYAKATLLEALQRGYCRIIHHDDKSRDAEWGKIVQLDAKWRLSNKIEAYSALVADIHKEFATRGVVFPVDQLIAFAGRSTFSGHRLLVVRTDGFLDEVSYSAILGQCDENRAQLHLVSKELEALIQFLLQIATDLLPQGVGAGLRKNYAKMVN